MHAAPQHTIRRFSTFDSLGKAVSRSFVPMLLSDSGATESSLFSASIRSTAVEDTYFSDNSASASLALGRTSSTVQQGGSGFYMLSLLLSGSGVLYQDGRSLQVQPGHLAFYETSQPLALFLGDGHREFVMRFPKDRLRLPTAFTDQLTATAIDRAHPLGAVVQHYLLSLPDQLATQSHAVQARLTRTGLDLLGTMFGQILGVTEQAFEPRAQLLQRVETHIEEHLANPELSPESIARAHYISARSLRDLFHSAGTTVTAVIRERRLQRCHDDLANPALAAHSCTAVATRWGFVSSAHFSRCFKERFGQSPSEFKKEQLQRISATG